MVVRTTSGPVAKTKKQSMEERDWGGIKLKQVFSANNAFEPLMTNFNRSWNELE